MNPLFPPMYSKPDKPIIFAIIPCWLWVFVLLPMYMPFLGLGLWEQWEVSVWLEVGYHVANGLLMLFIISGYLKDEWFMVSTDFRNYLKHVFATVGLIIGVEMVWMIILTFLGCNTVNMLECLPVVEMYVSHTPLFLVDLQPVFGTIALSVFAPISICALFYCLGFAPICNRKPWLAYLCIAVITLIPPIIDILWRGEASFVLIGYLTQLPIHLVACWSYQKTDNVWTPLVSLAITNLFFSIVLSLFIF
ncbi:MAG: hypothetical protein E7627_07795 [Ruminococcaceae bacterium]|nr:hypothetical protein [Oscillospiraceae bacterium]